jgi:1,4-alpha-glucan branching enzyme
MSFERIAIWSARHVVVTAVSCLAAAAGLFSTPWAIAADPLGATLHNDATVTFRVWAPFVDDVAVKLNGGAPAPLAKEPGHADPADVTWSGTIPGVKAGDQYRYAIRIGNVTKEFNDPRAQQLTGFDVVEFPDDSNIQKLDNVQSVIVDTAFYMPPFAEPTFNTMVIYELHIGAFNNTFAGAVAKLDYLKDLGVNAVEVLPITQNPQFKDHSPHDHDWGYDPVQLFAVKSKYGTPKEFKEFVKQCHQRGIAVIVDVVYNHLIDPNLLDGFGGFTQPEIPRGIFLYGGDRADTGFGPRPDYGRPQVRQYINDNALLLLRDYGVDGLRFDDTIDIRTYKRPGSDQRLPNDEGAQVLRETNFSYRNTDPKQPSKITIAEDLQSSVVVTQPSGPVGLEFSSQWDDDMVNVLRGVMVQIDDGNRDLRAIQNVLQKKIANDVFSRVVYSENHDQVGHPPGQDRLPAMIDRGNPESIFAKKRSTLAAGIVLTTPGIPMIFQGQEMLETRSFGFNSPTPIDFNRAADDRFKGIVQMYRDLIALRRNLAGKTSGLTGQNLNVFHVDNNNKTLGYHRWMNGGVGDDVVIIANLSNDRQANLNIGFPRGGMWNVRFNSGAKVYDSTFENGDSFDTLANPGAMDGLNFNANISVGPYSLIILSQ